jgi:hypothetical protein
LDNNFGEISSLIPSAPSQEFSCLDNNFGEISSLIPSAPSQEFSCLDNNFGEISSLIPSALPSPVVKLCAICLDKENNILFLPCAHLCCCSTCGENKKVTKCPLCRVKIKSKVVCFI